MKIDVGYVAELARLELTDEEKAVFQPQLEGIVKYVEKISEVNVDGVEPMRCVDFCDYFSAVGKKIRKFFSNIKPFLLLFHSNYNQAVEV